MYRIIFGLAVTLAAPTMALAQDAPATTPQAFYIDGGAWTYPTLAEVIGENVHVQSDVILDCEVKTDGKLKSCFVTQATGEDNNAAERAIGSAFLRYANVVPSSIDGGVLPGDRHIFHYSWSNFRVSDLADAASLPFVPEDMKARYAKAKYVDVDWMKLDYPPAAERQSITGAVVMDCFFGPSGIYERCDVVAEVPRNAGFAANAIKAVLTSGVDPSTVEGGLQPGDHHIIKANFLFP